MVIKFTNEPATLRIFTGRLIHSKSLSELEIVRHGSIIVLNDTIVYAGKQQDESIASLREKHPGAEVVELKDSQFLFPGLVDCHLHAPQWPNLALGMEGTLREWVEGWTDPMEVSGIENVCW